MRTYGRMVQQKPRSSGGGGRGASSLLPTTEMQVPAEERAAASAAAEFAAACTCVMQWTLHAAHLTAHCAAVVDSAQHRWCLRTSAGSRSSSSLALQSDSKLRCQSVSSQSLLLLWLLTTVPLTSLLLSALSALMSLPLSSASKCCSKFSPILASTSHSVCLRASSAKATNIASDPSYTYFGSTCGGWCEHKHSTHV